MKLRSMIIAASGAALLACSSLALAEQTLTTTNNSPDYSTVKVGMLCSSIQGHYTGPGHTTDSASWSTIQFFCGSSNPCKATLYVSQDPSKGKNCKGGSATVALHTDTGQIELPSSVVDDSGKTIKLSSPSTYHINIG